MTVIKKNPLVKGATGMIGGTFYFRETFGQLQMVNRPKKRKSYTENEIQNQSRWQLAASYARKQVKDPKIKKEYAAGINASSRSAYHVAMNDFLHSPTVDYVNTKLYTGAIDDTITIKAQDDFKVVSVKVEILNAEGKLLEKGEAVRYLYKPFIWKYRTSKINSTIKGTVIRAVAFDRPGNRGTCEAVLR